MLLTPLATTAQLSEVLLANINPAKLGLVLIEPIVASFPDHRFLNGSWGGLSSSQHPLQSMTPYSDDK
jgi:hypothetical protein